MNHCKTIAIVNQKGGVGKTTSTVNLGVGLAQAGNRVLLVDDDPQHSLTISLGIRNADDELDITLATAMQGQRTDITSTPLAGKSRNAESADIVGQSQGDSGDQVRRYIRLTSLIQPLLDLVDAGKIAFRPAVELSYLTEEEQNSLLDSINSEQSTPSLAQALKMKEFSQNGRLNADVILSIMCEQKPNQKEKISFQSERLKPFIPKNFTAKQTEDYVIKALEYYHRYQVRQKERDR